MPALSGSDLAPSTAPDVTSSFTATAIRASSYAGYGDLRRGVPVASPAGSFFDTTMF